MGYKVIFRAEARDEALAAAAYIRDRGNPDNAMNWYHGLEEAVRSLALMPQRCAYAREHGRIAGVVLRQLVYKSHRLIFTIRGDEVHVLHVRHTAQQPLDTL